MSWNLHVSYALSVRFGSVIQTRRSVDALFKTIKIRPGRGQPRPLPGGHTQTTVSSVAGRPTPHAVSMRETDVDRPADGSEQGQEPRAEESINQDIDIKGTTGLASEKITENGKR